MDVISRIGNGTTITHHCWDDGAQYLAACTDEGHIIVKRIGLEVEFETQIEDKIFVNVSLCKLGLVAASMDGCFFFFEHIDDHGVKEFKNIRRWQYNDPAFKDNPGDIVRGIQVLDAEVEHLKTQITLAA